MPHAEPGVVGFLDEQHERVQSAEPETLTRWFDQALIADNLEEVLH
ncbi:MAG: hypothetical protein WBG92_16305 [Thiohalocapsa sp.]